MLITLKQKEIQAALRLYVSQNGINLSGKNVDITFTAGRKESGLSAEVSIEDDGSMALYPETPAQPAFEPPAVEVQAIEVQPQAQLAITAANDPVPETVAPVSLFS